MNLIMILIAGVLVNPRHIIALEPDKKGCYVLVGSSRIYTVENTHCSVVLENIQKQINEIDNE